MSRAPDGRFPVVGSGRKRRWQGSFSAGESAEVPESGGGVAPGTEAIAKILSGRRFWKGESAGAKHLFMVGPTVPAGMWIFDVEEQIAVCQQAALAKEVVCFFEYLRLLREVAEVMQGLNRDDGVDFSGPAHSGQLCGPVIAHEICANKMQIAARVPFIGGVVESPLGEFEQVRGEIEAAVADVWQMPFEEFSQKAGTAGQFNDPRRGRRVGVDLAGDPGRYFLALRPLAIEARFPTARFGVGTNVG